MAPDPWLSMYDDSYHLAQEIAEKIHERNRYLRNGENPAKVNVTVRLLMKRLNEKIVQLRESLLRSVSTRQITQLEGDRRQNLIDELMSKEQQLQLSVTHDGPQPDVVRSSLMSGGAARNSRSNPWVLEEPEETRNLTAGDLRQQQHRIIAEQDAGLDALSNIIGRQKQMGYDIGNELDEQNGLWSRYKNHPTPQFKKPPTSEIIDDLANLVENTDAKVRTQTRHVKLIDKKSASCAMLVTIVLLLIAIVVVAVWPTK